MVVQPSNMYIGQVPYVNMYLTDNAPVFTSLTVRWQTCSNDGVCDGIWIYDLDMTKSALVGRTNLIFLMQPIQVSLQDLMDTIMVIIFT